MDAFHSFWSRPNSLRNNGEIGIPDFELLTTILSALEWKKQNGRITMVTDSEGAEYYQNLGMGNLWDEVDTSLDEIGSEIDPILFWAAGKLYALKHMGTPIVMLDTDLIIWKNMDGIYEHDIITAHDEALDPYVYPDKSVFYFKNGYTFPEEWDFQLRATNTAFLYMKDADFRDKYVNAAINFFKNVDLENLNPVTAMCFAEQRILPMIAKTEGKSMGYLLELEEADQQDFITHTWGFKGLLGEVPEAREEFCMRCVKRIMEDFPEEEMLLSQNRILRRYYERYRIG